MMTTVAQSAQNLEMSLVILISVKNVVHLVSDHDLEMERGTIIEVAENIKIGIEVERGRKKEIGKKEMGKRETEIEIESGNVNGNVIGTGRSGIVKVKRTRKGKKSVHAEAGADLISIELSWMRRREKRAVTGNFEKEKERGSPGNVIGKAGIILYLFILIDF